MSHAARRLLALFHFEHLHYGGPKEFYLGLYATAIAVIPQFALIWPDHEDELPSWSHPQATQVIDSAQSMPDLDVSTPLRAEKILDKDGFAISSNCISARIPSTVPSRTLHEQTEFG